MKLRLSWRATWTVVSAVAAVSMNVGLAMAQFPGGFIQKSYDRPDRSRLTQSQIQSFLPSGRGKFSFPFPYNTEGVRVTTPSDCGGADCVDYVGYSYWKSMNNHQDSDTMYIVLGLHRGSGGNGPTLFTYNKATDAVTNAGPLFDASSRWSWSSPNGWYFSARMATKLYVNYWGESTLYRFDVETKNFQQVLDIGWRTDIFGSGRNITQIHSSDDDLVHSFTVQDSNFTMLGCGVFHETTDEFQYFPKEGNFDECNIDASGRWLHIHQGGPDLDSYVIDLQTNAQKVILNQNGRLGHLDMGEGYMVGNSGAVPLANATLLYKLPLATTTYPVGPVVFYNADWNTAVVNHVSHQNRKIGVPAEQQYACGSNLDSDASRENEIACFRLDGSYDTLYVAPAMASFNAPGGGCDYCKYPKGNIDVTGQYFIWTSNMYGNRLDAFIVKVPSHLLTGSIPTAPPTSSTPPIISAVSASIVSSTSATIVWTTSTATDSQVEYGTTTAYGSKSSLNGNSVKSHMQVVGGLTPGTTYHYRVKSKDLSGNAAASPDATFTTTGSGGGIDGGPVVSLVTPVSGAMVKGKVKLAASASGSHGIAGVRFQVDGVDIAPERSSGPYTVSWNSATAAAGGHVITAVARDADGHVTTSEPVIVHIATTKSKGMAPFLENVVWTSAHNLTASGNSIQKTGGCDGCQDAGAISSQQFIGNGYIEFTASEVTTQRAIGLSNGDKNVTRGDIDFAIMLWNVNGGVIEIYESGIYKAGTVPYAPGDVFRVSVDQGVVRYWKNGAVFYTSSTKAKSRLLADTALWTASATITNAVIAKTP